MTKSQDVNGRGLFLMMESGIASVSFRGKSVEEILAASAAAGLDGVEWGSDVHVPAGDVSLARDVRRRTEAAGLKVLSYGSYYHLGAQAREEESDRVLASAAALGVRDVRIWGGSKNSAEFSPGGWDSLVAEGRRLAEKASEKGIVLSLECHNHTVTDDWKSAKHYLDAVGSPSMRMYWQPNELKDEAYNLAAARALAPYVTNIHVFSMDGDRHYPLAEHAGRWEKYLAALDNGAPHALILEFLYDDRIESLPQESRTLCSWIQARAVYPDGTAHKKI